MICVFVYTQLTSVELNARMISAIIQQGHILPRQRFRYIFHLPQSWSQQRKFTTILVIENTSLPQYCHTLVQAEASAVATFAASLTKLGDVFVNDAFGKNITILSARTTKKYININQHAHTVCTYTSLILSSLACPLSIVHSCSL